MKRKNVAIILYDKEKKILLQHRDEDAERLPGYWGFFGGGIKERESPKDAVKRETKEELNYDLVNPKQIMINEIKEGPHKGIRYVFIEEYNPEKKITLNEGQDMGWFKFDELRDLKIAPHHKEILNSINGKF